MLPTPPVAAEDIALLPSVDEFSSWDEEQVVEFLLSHNEIDELTHASMFLSFLSHQHVSHL